MKFIKFKDSWGDEVVSYLETEKYSNNGNLAVEVMSFQKEYKYFERWATLSVNIIPFKDKTMFLADVNNLSGCNLISVLENEGLIENLDQIISSGWCDYPLYKVTDKFFEYARKKGEKVDINGLL